MIVRRNKLALIAVIASAFLGGSNAAFAKIALQEIPPFTFTLLRFALASIFMLPFVLRKKIPLQPRDLIKGIVVSLFAVGNVALFAFGIRLTSATTAGILYSVGPLLTAVFSYILLKQRLNTDKIMGIVVGFVGISFITLLPLVDKTSVFKGSVLGNVLILFGAACFALYTILSKPLQLKYSPLQITFLFSIIAFMSHIPLSIFQANESPLIFSSLSTSALLSLLYVSLFGTAGLYIIYQTAIQHGSPLMASLMLYLQPLFTYLTAFIFLGEHITLGFIFGAMVVFCGVWLTTRSQ